MVTSRWWIVGRIGFVFDPIANVIEQSSAFHGYAVSVYADIFLRAAILPRPLPHVAKHALVQAQGVIHGQEHGGLGRPAPRPGCALEDVLGFGFVEIAPSGDPALP